MIPTSSRLSEKAYEILKLDLDGYQELTPKKPCGAAAHAQLGSVDPAKLISGELRDPDMARAVACGLWLWHDWLDEAHKIAQGLGNETGSFWHAIMHRREGDFQNSKYWLARCQEHPARKAIGNQAALVLNDLPADKRLMKLTMNGWNAEYFVDLVEKQTSTSDEEFGRILVVLQRLEWRVLLEYCAAMA